MSKKQSCPQPVPLNIVCSVCGEPWGQHKPDGSGDVTTLECVRLLRERIARTPYQMQPFWPRPHVPPSWMPQTLPYTCKADRLTNAPPEVLARTPVIVGASCE